MSYKVQCIECEKKETFFDAKDITFAKWTIMAWMLPSGEPKVLCPNCNYNTIKNTPLKRKKKADEN